MYSISKRILKSKENGFESHKWPMGHKRSSSILRFLFETLLKTTQFSISLPHGDSGLFIVEFIGYHLGSVD